MDIPITLYNDIVTFFLKLPNVHDDTGRRALVYQAGIDDQLFHHITWNTPSAQFFPVFVKQLFQYGKIQDGRYALEAVLGTAKHHVGIGQQKGCDTILQQLGEIRDTLGHERRILHKPLIFLTETLSFQKKRLLAALIILVIIIGFLMYRQSIHQ